MALEGDGPEDDVADDDDELVEVPGLGVENGEFADGDPWG